MKDRLKALPGHRGKRGDAGRRLVSRRWPQPASAASLTEVTNFGTNPSNLRMHLYVPDQRRAPGRPILVAVHYCTGSGPAFYSGTEFASLADRYGFIVIYPSATRSGGCFDVSSPQALQPRRRQRPGRHRVDGHGTSQQRHNADPDRVFVTGASSGAHDDQRPARRLPGRVQGRAPRSWACRSAASPPPTARCWNSACANGSIIRTAAAVGRPGPRPPTPATPAPGRGCSCGTAPTDATLRYPNFGEEIKQWTNVHGVSQTPAFTDTPAVRLDPHPLRRHRHHGAGRGDQHRRASGTACRWPAGRRRSSSSAWTRRAQPAPARTPPTADPPPSRRPVATAARRPPVGACRGHLHRERLEHRAHREHHHHQHRHHADQRLDAGLHPARRTDHHLRLERHLLARPAAQVTARNVSYNGDDRARRLGRHRLPGHPHRQHRQAGRRSPSTAPPARSPEQAAHPVPGSPRV